MAGTYAKYVVSGGGGGGGSGITSLTGDVTASGPGSAVATVTNAGGSNQISFDNAGDIQCNKLVLNSGGDVGNPVIQFNGTSSNQTGFFQPGQDVVGLTIEGSQVAAFTLTGLELDNTNPAPASGVGTLTNLPTGASGDPAVYLQIVVNGVTYVFPGWAL